MQKLTIPYAWGKQSEQAGPFVVVNGGSHGNETPGVETVQELLDIMDSIELLSGTLVLSLGNKPAIDAKLRSLHPRDLNKCFGSVISLVDGKPSFESIRAQQLKAAWAGADLLLDLHATMKPAKPFLIVPNLQNKTDAVSILTHLGIPTVVTGKGLYPPNGDPIYADTYVDSMGGLGVTVEAGWAEDPSLKDLTARVKSVLIHMGLLEGSSSTIPTELIPWDAHRNVIAGKGFQFTRAWGNFDEIPAGTLIAHDSTGAVSAKEDSIILFPKPLGSIVEGQEACILAKKV